MIARVGKRVPVRIARKHGTNTVLGRASLKTCLSAICLASPELLLDRSNDYIVYAVDPEESAPRSSTSSPQKATPSSAPVFVGKGFFSGGIAEPGDGTSYVTGYVRLETRTSSAFSSDEEETSSTEYLEIVLRMKEASHGGREQYQHRLRGIAAATVPSPQPPASAPTPTAAPDVPTKAQNAPVLSNGNEPRPSQPPIAAEPASSPSGQVLQVLQAMQAHQGTLSEGQQSHLMGLLGMVAGAMQSGALSTDTSTTQPPSRSSTSAPPRESKTAARASRPGLRDTRTDLPRICYNCGTTHATTWRILTLPSGVTINHPASERPPSDVVPLTWTPQYANQGPIQTHSEARWQACNPCGLYFAKYGVARPEYVRNFVARPTKEEKKRDMPHHTSKPSSKIKRENTAPTPGGRTGFARTLSAVANRDAERLHKRARQMHDENLPPASPALEASDMRDHAPSVTTPPMPKSPPKRRTPPRPSMLTSPSSTFGMSSSIMNSSPNTMLNALMSNSNVDFNKRSAHAVLSPHKNRAPFEALSSPVRRSPRKQPPGTVADVNPYATVMRTASSPVPKKNGPQESSRNSLTSPSDRTQILPTLNPFMGLDSLDDEADPFGCPPSPTEGRTSRVKPAPPKRDVRTPSRMPKDHGWTQSQSPTLGLSDPLRISESNSIKDLFCGQTHDDWMGEWHSSEPTTALTDVTNEKDASGAGTSAAAAPASTSPVTSLVKRTPRRPMPATVEDASSSHSGSPCATSPEMDDSLVDLIEDPYGLLSACGFGMMQPGEPGANGVGPVNAQSAGGFSADAFNNIEIHQAPSFAQQLDAFTQSGHLGVAAHMHTPQDVSALTTSMPEVRTFGHGNKPAASTDLETFLDDPTVQAMLSNANNASGGASAQPAPTSAPVLTS